VARPIGGENIAPNRLLCLATKVKDGTQAQRYCPDQKDKSFHDSPEPAVREETNEKNEYEEEAKAKASD
jgi:hypothetical protein